MNRDTAFDYVCVMYLPCACLDVSLFEFFVFLLALNVTHSLCIITPPLVSMWSHLDEFLEEEGMQEPSPGLPKSFMCHISHTSKSKQTPWIHNRLQTRATSWVLFISTTILYPPNQFSCLFVIQIFVHLLQISLWKDMCLSLYWKIKSLGGLLAVYQGGVMSFTSLTVFMCIYA